MTKLNIGFGGYQAMAFYNHSDVADLMVLLSMSIKAFGIYNPNWIILLKIFSAVYMKYGLILSSKKSILQR